MGGIYGLMLLVRLDEGVKKLKDREEKLERVMSENTKLDTMMLDQRQVIEELEVKQKEMEEHIRNLKIEIFNGEEYVTKIMEREKNSYKAWATKYDKEQEKVMEIQLENINLKQKLELEGKEKERLNVCIQDLEKYVLT